MTATDAADVAEEVVEVARESSGGVGLAIGAFLLGAGIGGGVAYLLTKRRLETKYSKIADDRIEEMQTHYREKAVALEAQAAKEDLEDIVAEKGYGTPTPSVNAAPPMAVSPPEKVVEDAKDTLKDARPEAAKVIKEPQEHAEIRNVFEDHGDDRQDDRKDAWDWHEERKNRSPDTPYVVHYDERNDMDYQDVSLTYYEVDNVVCDSQTNEPLTEADREQLLGEENLDKFGHGSDDPSVVFIRNDAMEILYEVVRMPQSYEEEVLGLSHTDPIRGNLERMRAREREQFDDDA